MAGTKPSRSDRRRTTKPCATSDAQNPTHVERRAICGTCPPCRAATRAALEPAHVVRLTKREKASFKKRLLRHAQRFGWGGVAETAAEHGIEVQVPREERASKPRRVPTKTTVRQLLERGTSPEGIAEVLNTSPSRARRLIAEVEAEDV